MIRQACFYLVMAGAAAAQDFNLPVFKLPMIESFQIREAIDRDYQKGLSDLDARRWQSAIADFEAASHNKSVMDAALYWKAYALSHAGKLEESISTLGRLQKLFPSSRWVKDAEALSMEIQSDAGHPVNPADETDQDLKLLALNTVMQTNAETATPALLKIINGTGSDKTKEHALFVLAQSDSAQAHKALREMARGASGPALQMKAVRMMGMIGGAGPSQELAVLYAASSEPALKREILNGMMLSGSRATLASVAKTEADPSLRNSAILNLSLTGGQVELLNLYNSGASLDQKKQILNTVFLTGDVNMLLDVLKREKNASLRIAAVQSLGAMGGPSRELTSVYSHDNDIAVKHAILDALASKHDADALAELVGTEKNEREKAEILRRMALVESQATAK